ncbi:4'-phosphopantetheinyl transferase family protein [Eubacterium oxidoreducens]|uniref:Phosphopantetheine--protein transferase domain-containing protein n=1 Tax=Eubacterium oxidoreducens TaxID=1732 RepID=A0A1G6BD71_EUBOX|nr:4'-phosphopantetheinyl transferase superfamily protein [Eubacterium oxidoreducens]SDB18558.1 phosphopantetheine--protein transferase domain-containing protein [Eubacterium oxidoreducens]
MISPRKPCVLITKTPTISPGAIIAWGRNTKRRVEYADRYKNDEDAVNALFAQIVLGECLEQFLNHRVTAEEVEIAKTQSGQPYLEAFPQLHVSISHTDGMIGVAISEEPIGIDVQKVRKIRDSLLNRTLSPKEQCIVRERECPEKSFSMLWAMKEAIVKMHGTGFVEYPTNIDLANLVELTSDALEAKEGAQYEGHGIYTHWEEDVAVCIYGPNDGYELF